jgi:hypothetical protein
MINKIIRLINKINHIYDKVNLLESKIDDTLVLHGTLLSNINRTRLHEILNNIHLSEFKVFSQWGDDGIIDFLINYLDIENNVFVEFGVSDYKESNTRFLLIKNNWKGLVLDSSEWNINKIINDPIYWKYDLDAKCIFITRTNINSILKQNGILGDIGLLHIDIDGNDYWIWKEISVINPVIVVVEYNSIFNLNPWTIPYFEDFERRKKHYSNLYAGASLLSFCDLAEEKGYFFIGSNSAGNNAYFIRKDKIKGLKVLTPEKGYVESKFRESRDINNNLTYVSGKNRLKLLEGLEIYNTRTNAIELIK